MDRTSLRVPSVALLLAASAAPARADVKLPAVVGPHMVLQRETEVAVWGFADPGEAVTVQASWSNAPLRATAGADGRFSVQLKTPAAGGPFTIDVNGKNKIHLDDILVGEVWLCGGQSNMEWAFAYGGVKNLEAERAAANDPQLRFFDAPNRLSPQPESDCAATWAACTPESVNGFSCAGYFFARELRRELGVPVGLIGVNWGGTVAEAWVSEPVISKFPQFAPALAQVAAARAKPGTPDPAVAAMAGWWAALDTEDPGSKGGWAAANFDDAAWESVTLPAFFAGPLEKYDGSVWYRRALDVPATLAGKDVDLELGAIDDMDQVFLDGVKVGAMELHGHWTEERHYRVPAAKMTAGRHVLAIRVVDTGGGGGFAAKADAFRIVAAAGGAALPLGGAWKQKVGLEASRFPPLPATASPLHPNLPTVLFNGLVNPVIPFGVRGALWYQGESNRGRAAEYVDVMTALIGDWRARFGRPAMPFLFVQIAPYNYEKTKAPTAELRQAQFETLKVPGTGMVVTMDIGDPGNIHPAEKQEVGRRLALWALAKTYGKSGLECSGPLYESQQVEGDKIRVRFSHAAGLNAKGGALKLFEIAGADGHFVAAEATIDGETVVVHAAGVKEPKEVRFGFTDEEATNLFNGAGLPASPFCRIAR